MSTAVLTMPEAPEALEDAADFEEVARSRIL